MENKKKLTFPVKLLPLLNGEGNSVICPYGIKTVLSMVAEGAREESLNQILYVLGFDSLGELRESVLAVQDTRCSAFKSENSLELEKGEEDLELLSNFKQIMEECYNSSVTELSSDSNAALLLRNVATFKAEWLYQMERDVSHENFFNNADGSKSYPAFLNATQDFLRYYKGSDKDGEYTYVNAVAIPYKLNNERIPYELVLIEGNKELTSDVLENIFDNMCLKECEVVFPEFTIQSTFDLLPVMQCLGVNAIFNRAFPGLDKIATQPLYTERFIQRAEFEVDKDGTVAKAVTEMDCFLGDFITETEKIVFNKPFHYFLRNTITGEIIFMGKVNKLSDCERRKRVGIPMLFGKIYV